MCSAGGASENSGSEDSSAIGDEDIVDPAREAPEQEAELTEQTSQSYEYNEKQQYPTDIKRINNDLQVKCLVEKDKINKQREFCKGGGENLGSEEYARLACEGIRLMLNNRSIEAEELFRHHTDDNLHMAMGYCYISFMNAVMSFEEEKVQQSMNILRGMERRCGAPGENGWFSSVKNIVLGARNGIDISEDSGCFLEQQIILADAQVLLAILTFLSQEIGSYVKGGWVLRKAWKVYEHNYSKVKRMYLHTFGENSHASASPPESVSDSEDLQSPASSTCCSTGSWGSQETGYKITDQGGTANCASSPGTDTTKPPITNNQNNDVLLISSVPGLRMPISKSVPNLKGFLQHCHKNHKNSKSNISPELISRLMASVSFGYGLFQLCTSLLPPSLLKLVHVLGLQGDRHSGLAALMFTRKSNDMRAPLATLALLWYHTVVRPFFALDGVHVRAGVEASHLLLRENDANYNNSALFLFFRGRTLRLQGDIGGALTAYRGALGASQQRELQLLALHEVAWCHLLQLNYISAQGAFANLRKESRWSKSFYTYMSAVCVGASGHLTDCKDLMLEVPLLVRRANHALESFLVRRANTCENIVLTKSYCLLRSFELLYLWNAMSSCSIEHRVNILNDCQEIGECGPQEGLRQLIMGSILDTLGSTPEAISHLRNAISSGHSNSYETWVPAFASYELGLLLSGDTKTLTEGRTLLEAAKDNYSGFDFENRLNVRIHAALKNLQ